MEMVNSEGATGKVSVRIEEDQIVRLSFTGPGETDEEHLRMAKETKAAYRGVLAKFPDIDFRILVDLSNAGIPTKEAREIYVSILSDKRIKRTAFFGVGKAIKSIVSFIVSAAGKGDNVEFFIDEETALKWLRTGSE